MNVATFRSKWYAGLCNLFFFMCYRNKLCYNHSVFISYDSAWVGAAYRSTRRFIGAAGTTN